MTRDRGIHLDVRASIADALALLERAADFGGER